MLISLDFIILCVDFVWSHAEIFRYLAFFFVKFVQARKLLSLKDIVIESEMVSFLLYFVENWLFNMSLHDIFMT